LVARGIAIQCCFNQEAIDNLEGVYWGSVTDHAPFDPERVGPMVGQVKNKVKADTSGADKVQVPGSNPELSSIVVFLDMGNTSNYAESGTRLLLETGEESLDRLRKSLKTKMSDERRKIATNAIKALEKNSNRYCISARGCDEHVFGILTEMGIAEEWNKLVELTVDDPSQAGSQLHETMRPLHSLHPNTGYMKWTKEFLPPAQS
jgi:hypothetical protein